jgi:hypothetical protein
MPITISGSGTVTGISAGGLPDGCITTADIADANVTTAKLGTSEASGLAKAWVNFNGTGTVAIRASYNVSSITDNGVGDYTVNFTTALADANYAVTGAGRYTDGGNASAMRVVSIASAGTLATAMSTSSVRLGTTYVNGGVEDLQVVSVAIFR